MVTNCANPGCKATLQSFAEGRFFHFDIVSVSVSADDARGGGFDEQPQRQNMDYWLCGDCSASFNLVLEPMRGLKLVPFGNTNVVSKPLAAD
jgi:hypothetical protein